MPGSFSKRRGRPFHYAAAFNNVVRASCTSSIYRQRRIVCRDCGIRTERIEFADPKARVTRRLRQQIGVDCQSMPTSHAAVRHGVSWGKARRAEKAFLAEWDRTRVKRRPRPIGLDEIQHGKGQRF